MGNEMADQDNITPPPADNPGDELSIDQAELDAMMAAMQGNAPDAPPADAPSPAETVPPAAEAGAEDVMRIDPAELAAAVNDLNGDADGTGADADTAAAALRDEMAAAIAAEQAAAAPASSRPSRPPPAAAPAEPARPAVLGGQINHIAPDSAQPFSLPDLDDPAEAGQLSALNLLDDVELNVKIELGRTELYIEEVLELGVGSVVELNKLAGDPVDIFVNEQLIARGEVLVLNDNFCVRINDILAPVAEVEH
jgi:flagellar motor switch protein FliN/FliY